MFSQATVPKWNEGLSTLLPCLAQVVQYAHEMEEKMANPKIGGRAHCIALILLSWHLTLFSNVLSGQPFVTFFSNSLFLHFSFPFFAMKCLFETGYPFLAWT